MKRDRKMDAETAATLAELAEISGTMTKSGINHRLRKIREIASAIPQEQ